MTASSSPRTPVGRASGAAASRRSTSGSGTWTATGFRVVKLFLNLSKEEQRQRFLQRIERRDKNWKFSASDVAERERWDDYQRAFSRMLSHTSTPWAPWYVIPADHKWFARISAAAVIAHTLTGIGSRYPEPDDEEQQHLQAARAQLETEDPRYRTSGSGRL